jgi:3D (Asp-Asp-Asp) domain-containing protein
MTQHFRGLTAPSLQLAVIHNNQADYKALNRSVIGCCVKIEEKKEWRLIMKNLARGSVVLSVLALVITFIYDQQNVEASLFQANDSQTENLIKENIEINFVESSIDNLETVTDSSETITGSSDDKKLVKKTAIVERRSNARSFRATAYCLKGRTAVGSGVRRGIVAADPRVLPLGTRIYISAGKYSGTYTVTDTGGAIKGRILDLWVPNCGEAIRFGRRNISVSVLGR